ncbi:MAG: hypothetical protein NXI23_07160 [Bacteroidetes bacterium]|jgi:hypothetical protein|nr:hypothetical protein [Bacteroidota bacterium]
MNTFFEKTVDANSFLKVIFGHLIVLISLYTIFYLVGQFSITPTSETVIQYDAGWYQKISQGGYFEDEKGHSGVAFFPLFPIIWRFFQLSPIGICILNTSFFYLAFWGVSKIFNLKIKEILLYLSISSILFFYLPFAESVFFLTSSMALIGIFKSNQKNKHRYGWKGLAIVGLLLASMTRPSMLFFFPAIFFMEFIHYKKRSDTIQNILVYSFSVILGMMIVVWIQYNATGEWFAFFNTQSEQWDNKLQLPQLPFRTWGGSKRMWLDGLAFCSTLAAFLFCTRWFWKWILNQFLLEKKPPKAVLFSMVYLTMAGVFTVFFHGEDPIGGTTLMAMNRYVFATPFFLLAMIYLFKNSPFEGKDMMWFWIFLFLNLVLLGAFAPSNFPNHLRTIVYLLFIFSFLSFHFRKTYLWSWILVYTINLILQINLIDSYLNGIWVG